MISTSIFVYRCKLERLIVSSALVSACNPRSYYRARETTNSYLDANMFRGQNVEATFQRSFFSFCTRTIATPNWLAICFNSFRDSFTSILLTRGSAWRSGDVTKRLIDWSCVRVTRAGCRDILSE